MFRRQLLRQSRTLSESLTALPQVRWSQFSSATFLAPRAAIPASFSSGVGRRWQSTNGDKKLEGETSASTEEAKPAEAKEDPLKDELEKSKKEIIDLKVW